MTSRNTNIAAPHIFRGCVICSSVVPVGCYLCMVCLDSDLSVSFLFSTGMGLTPIDFSTAEDL